MNRIREVLSLWVDEAQRAELRPVIHLPAAARASVRRALSARERAERAEVDASVVLRDSIRELTQRERLSTRDVAALLELSPSRVDQLKAERGGGRVVASDDDAGRKVAVSPARKTANKETASSPRRSAAKKP